MYAPIELEAMSRRSVVRQAAEVNRHGRMYVKHTKTAERRLATLTRFFGAHAEFVKLGLASVVEYLAFLGGLCGIYCLDLLLFSPSAEYAATVLGGGGMVGATAAKWIVPACFLAVEILIALKIEHARYEEQFAFGGGAAKRGWTLVGVVVSLVMPLAALATSDAAGSVAGSDAPCTTFVVLGIISFAAHVLVLFGGRTAQEAKTYLAFILLRAFHAEREERARNRGTAALANLNEAFIGYAHAWRAHNHRYARLPSGPFDHEVVQVLRREFPEVAVGRPEPSFPPAVEKEES